jgi:hypothetical protein
MQDFAVARDPPPKLRPVPICKEVAPGMSLKAVLSVLVIVGLGACNGSDPSQPLTGGNGDSDSLAAPPSIPGTTAGNPAPTDSTPADSTPAPGDTVPQPADSTPVVTPVNPAHVGIPFGPYSLPTEMYGQDFTGAYRPMWKDRSLLADLAAARRSNTRVLLNLTGSERFLSDAHGFSFAKWKERVDRFRDVDISSYIADGTIVAHFIMDEPDDPSNWNGKQVTPAQVDQIAQYSKQLWPDLPTVVRAVPGYFKGYHFQYLDGAWAQYLDRFGPVDPYIATNIRDAQQAGLSLVGGLNVLNGGAKNSGIPGRKVGKFAMNADEIRTWGGKLLDQPYFCAFVMWEYDPRYFSRPDIKAALAELKQKAEAHVKQSCRRP